MDSGTAPPSCWAALSRSVQLTGHRRSARPHPAALGPTAFDAVVLHGGGDVDPLAVRRGAGVGGAVHHRARPPRVQARRTSRRRRAGSAGVAICRGLSAAQRGDGRHAPPAPRHERPLAPHPPDPGRADLPPRLRAGHQPSAGLPLGAPPGHQPASARASRVVARADDGVIEAVERDPGLDGRRAVAPGGHRRRRPGAAAAVREVEIAQPTATSSLCRQRSPSKAS